MELKAGDLVQCRTDTYIFDVDNNTSFWAERGSILLVVESWQIHNKPDKAYYSHKFVVLAEQKLGSFYCHIGNLKDHFAKVEL